MRKMRENAPFATYKGRDMIDTKHAIERSAEREKYDRDFPNAEAFKKKYISMMKDAIDQIITTYKDTAGGYVIHSKGSQLGFAIDWRPDKYSQNNINCAIVVTVFDRKPVHYKKYDSDTLLYVERVIAQVRKYVKSNSKGRLLEETSKDTYSHFESDIGKIHVFDGEVVSFDSEIIFVE